MDNLVTYICINMHSACIPTNFETGNQTPRMIENPDPRIFSMQKYTVAFPGFNGMKKMGECGYARETMERLPNITPEYMADALKMYFDESKLHRNKVEQRRTDMKCARDANMCGVKGWDQMEPKNDFFYYKKYEIDEKDKDFRSIEVLNGPLKGVNILNYRFLSRHLPLPENIANLVDESNIEYFIQDNIRVLKSIDLMQLMQLLKHISLSNVFVIDVGCSVNYYANSGRDNDAMKRSARQDLNNGSLSGLTHTVDFIPAEQRREKMKSDPEDCVKCDTKDACVAGSVAGLACCIGSCATGFNPVVPSVVGALASGVTTMNLTKRIPIKEPKEILKIKRTGGRTRKTKTKTKEKKSKRKKSFYRKRRAKTRVI
jgi:hypothetical protein